VSASVSINTPNSLKLSDIVLAVLLRRARMRAAVLTLVRTLAVDYCCPLLPDISGHLMDRMQPVLNAPAFFSATCAGHAAPFSAKFNFNTAVATGTGVDRIFARGMHSMNC